MMDVGTVSLCIEERGSGPLVVSIEGHMAHLIATPDGFCDGLVRRGYRVVRFDNRDVGRSSRVAALYDLRDMAEDVHRLIGRLGGPAVVVGRSMGGAVAQLLALSHPEDVTALGLFFTFPESSSRWEPRPAPFTDEASWLAWQRESLPAIAGSAYPWDPGEMDALAIRAWSRGVEWAGFERQRRAMAMTGRWHAGEISVPVTVVHGDEDPVVPLSVGRRLHRLIPGSRLETVAGLGHQQPAALDEFFVDVVDEVARRT